VAVGEPVSVRLVRGGGRPVVYELGLRGEEVVGLNGGDLERVRRKFGMLFQNAALFDSLSVSENVAFGLMEGQGMDRSEAESIAMEKMAAVGLGPEVAVLSPAELSGGMRKRVGLARAIATAPDIIFFDEPTTGLDPIMGDVINDLIVKCVRELGATALSITHDMASARKISDRIAMLYEGKIIWAGATEDIDESGNPYVDQFIHGRAEGPIHMQVRAL
jgi:phospholipid/cholesterol/gamma-HCH transport system ATP-binding protein